MKSIVVEWLRKYNVDSLNAMSKTYFISEGNGNLRKNIKPFWKIKYFWVKKQKF